jgi:hypothetical protein
LHGTPNLSNIILTWTTEEQKEEFKDYDDSRDFYSA